MNKFALIFVAAFIAFVGYWFMVYNEIVGLYQQVQSSWSQVQNVYQRRADLIPNLVNTVKGYTAYESATLEAVVEARSAAIASPELSVPDNQSQIGKLDQTQQALSNALGRLMVVVERYPDLKASTNFISLQAELSGTENRISVERRRYVIAAQTYNTYIQQLPAKFVAEKLGYKPVPYFTADVGTSSPPKVDFHQ